MAFVIKKDSQSFKYLSRWKGGYEQMARDGYNRHVARDYCAYYRDVLKLIGNQFLLLNMIPAALVAFLVMLGYYGNPALSVISIATFIYAAYGVVACTLAFALCFVFVGMNYVPPVFDKGKDYIRKQLRKIPTRTVETVEDKPGFFATWYDQFKHSYCATVEYETADYEAEKKYDDYWR